MKLREVTVGMVRSVLSSPDKREEGRGGRQLFHKKLGTRILKVVHMTHGKASIVVISVVWYSE